MLDKVANCFGCSVQTLYLEKFEMHATDLCQFLHLHRLCNQMYLQMYNLIINSVE